MTSHLSDRPVLSCLNTIGESRMSRFFKPSLLLIPFIISVLTGCFPGVYYIDIPQGNLIDDSKLAEVKIGMEPRQVLYLLGTPLITNSFNQNRWDYYYSIRHNSDTEVVHHVTILFTESRVVAVQNHVKE